MSNDPETPEQNRPSPPAGHEAVDQHWLALKERRGLLSTRDNPSAKLDYLVTAAITIPVTLTAMGKAEDNPLSASVKLILRYVPDRLLLARASFGDYLAGLTARPWPDLESLGVVAIEDLNSELIPRWLHVTLSTTLASTEHAVTLEDRQPRWDNAKLLHRMDRI